MSIVFLALTFVITGGSKLAAVSPSPENFARWGLSPAFMYTIGGLEVVGGVALLLPRLVTFAAGGLIVLMLGAIETGVVHREVLHVALPLALIGLLGSVGVLRRCPTSAQAIDPLRPLPPDAPIG